MAYTKNKNPKRTWRAKKTVLKWKSNGGARRAILAVIILAMMVVVLATLFALQNTPEHAVKRKVEEIARDYYENYFYESVLKHGTAEIDEVLKRYEEPGFSKVSLEQLTLYDNAKYAKVRPALEAYCDLGQSSIKIFPVSPFGRSDYRIEYSYSCTF